MGGIPKSERPRGLLWHIARLHPVWVTLAVWIAWLAHARYADSVVEIPNVVAISVIGFIALYMGYPLFVLLFTAGRFRSKTLQRPAPALAAFFAIAIIFPAAVLVGPDRMTALIDAANAGDLMAWLTFGIPFFSVVIAYGYLVIGAALALAGAEKGPAARFWRKFGTALQFFYLPFCVYFLHRRIRRLVCELAGGEPTAHDLPMERLILKPMARGHLSLELTEFPNWQSFERYAEELLRRLDGQVVRKASGVDMHIWSVEVETVPLRLVYEDYPNRICLESDSYPGDMLLRQLHKRLSPPASV
jgi:hypothetical protein